ncbi:DUF1835 domain-containing protein [Roseospira visakhapatnamensis]|uniref:DUF1835 domain-containing protein n=1 Tax=Roseospira visakhapatnamensis TaxID=390880 RepID=A0A7W6W8F7_9PROT|nr:DUF1835 domain-containing protein [Roseospira visakhapatnamensis]MBB4264814.1 hypothetical protein [Roseospira visakhapatnamensis]
MSSAPYGIVSLATAGGARARSGPRRAAPDGDRSTLHVRCGSDIRDALATLGFQGDFLEVADPLVQGPVPATRSARAYQDTRATFIADAYGMPPTEARARMAGEAAGLAAEDRYARVVLWFEHDAYDQLILARVLDSLHGARGLAERVALVLYDPARDGAVVGRVRGLGELTPERLRLLWNRRRAVTPTLTAQGRRVWDALRRPEPRALARLARGPVPGLPTMSPALTRWLQDLPWVGDGLGVTERGILRALAARDGAAATGALFRAYLETDDQPTLGDAMFVAVILGLTRGPAPAVVRTDEGGPERRATWAMTDTGRRLLDGAADWAALGGLDRWMGGLRLLSPAPAWRWDADAGAPVPVSGAGSPLT